LQLTVVAISFEQEKNKTKSSGNHSRKREREKEKRNTGEGEREMFDQRNGCLFSCSSLLRLLEWSLAILTLLVLISTQVECVGCPNTNITFGASSSLNVRYQFDNLTGTLWHPITADVTGDSHPEIFFLNDVRGNRSLVALHFTSGSLQLLWQQYNYYYLLNQMAVAKIPNTNRWMICGFVSLRKNASNVANITCTDAATGAVMFTIPTNSSLSAGSFLYSLSIERLYQSDPNNIFILVLSQVFKYNSTHGVSHYCDIPSKPDAMIPHAADLDLDGNSEMIFGQCVYSSLNCTQLWCAANSTLFTAVANLDTNDPEGEVVFIMQNGNQVAVYQHTGSLLWSVPTGNLLYNVPAIADFDGDGVPDIGVLGFIDFSVFNGVNGTILSTSLTTFYLQYPYGSLSAFDFQNDGKPEFFVCDFLKYCYLVSKDWQQTITTPISYGGTSPIISDIDLDGSADIVVAGFAIQVLGSNDTWAASDVVWNQNAFNDENYDHLTGYPAVTKASERFRSRPALCPSASPSSLLSRTRTQSASSSRTPAQTMMTSTTTPSSSMLPSQSSSTSVGVSPESSSSPSSSPSQSSRLVHSTKPRSNIILPLGSSITVEPTSARKRVYQIGGCNSCKVSAIYVRSIVYHWR